MRLARTSFATAAGVSIRRNTAPLIPMLLNETQKLHADFQHEREQNHRLEEELSALQRTVQSLLESKSAAADR